MLQFNQQLVITAGLELLYETPTVGRLLVHKEQEKLVMFHQRLADCDSCGYHGLLLLQLDSASNSY